MEKLVRRGFAASFVINGIMLSAKKRYSLASKLEGNIYLIGNCPISNSIEYPSCFYPSYQVAL